MAWWTMMRKFYAVSVRWVQTPVHPPLIEGVLGIYGDWLRYNSDTWMLSSVSEAKAISDHIVRVLTPDDSVIVMNFSPADSWGSAPKFMWEWFSDQMEKQHLARAFQAKPLKGPSH
jgi:hypothetical protein